MAFGGYEQTLRDITAANNQFNLDQVQMVNSFNAHQAHINREWQERMSRNAHLYEVEDLKRAGLNPVLSAGGQGAQVTSGATASGQKAVADNTLSQGMISLMNNAMSASSALNVAKVYAAATMYSADMQFKGKSETGMNGVITNAFNRFLGVEDKILKNANEKSYSEIISKGMKNILQQVSNSGSSLSKKYNNFKDKFNNSNFDIRMPR